MKKVLIIDDERDILDVLLRFLSRNEKFEVEIMSNPKEGLNMINENNYDLVLLDIMMPDMDGIEVLTKIKASKPDLKVIMMTAYSTIEKTTKCNEIGAENYLTKPFESLRDVENKILDLLDL